MLHVQSFFGVTCNDASRGTPTFAQEPALSSRRARRTLVTLRLTTQGKDDRQSQMNSSPFAYGVTLERFPKIDISVHLTNISGVGKSDSYGLGHPGGLITRKPVVQIYSPLSVFINCDPVCIWLKGYTVYLVMSLRWPC